MVSEQLIKIIIKAEDMASEQANKVKDNFKGLGDAAKKANETASQSSDKYNKKLQETSQKLDKTIDNVNKVGNEGSKSFRELSKSQQDVVTKFNMLNKSTQTTLQAIREVGIESRDMFPDGNKALSSFSKLDNLTRSWSGSLDYAKTKMGLLGNNTNSLKGKIQTTGMAIQTYLGTKWDIIKPKVTSVAQTIQTKLGSAINTVKGKLTGLNSGFNKLATGAKTAGSSLGFLGNAASMAVGMIGYDLVNATVESTRASLNARSSLQAFGQRLGMSGTEVAAYQQHLDGLQSAYKKIDMDVVGQQATDMAFRLGISKDSIKELTETTAIFSDAMQRNGRSAEDSMLAMSDAMDGQFTRLKEIGISREDLMNDGWDGDINNKTDLLKAMNKALKDQHYDELAKSVDTLDDAWKVLEVTMGNLLEAILLPLLPAIVGVVSGFADAINGIRSAWDKLPDGAKLGLIVTAIGGLAMAIVGVLIPVIASSLMSALVSFASMLGITIVPSLATLSGAFMTVAGAVWATVAPLLPFIAIAALLAVAIYEIGKAFGWWYNVQGMLQAIQTGIMRLWAAFVNHPDVQGFIKILSNAWSDFSKWVGQAWDSVLKFFGVNSSDKFYLVASLIKGIGDAWAAIKPFVWAAAVYMVNTFKVIGTIVGFAIQVGQSVYNALKPIVCILLGCSPGIVPALQNVQEMFTVVWNYILGFIGGIIGGVVSALQPVLNILTSIGNFLLGAFRFAWTTVVLVFAIVRTHINVLMLIFNKLLSGQISLSSALGMIWNTIKSMFVMVLTTIVQRVRVFALHIISKAIETGRGFVHGIISFVMNLPGNIGMYLYSVVSRIVSAGASWISNATSQASSMVSGVINNVSQLPGRVGQEFMNIGSRIVSAGSDLVNKAKNIGKNIVDGLLGAMGIHSPGIIQTKVITEFKNMVGGVEDQMAPAGEVAREFGETMVDQFGDVDLTPNLGYKDLDMPEMNMNVGMDTSAVSSTNQMVTSSYNQLATQTGASLNSMVNQDILAYNKIKQNDANTLNQMVSNDKLAYTKIRQNDSTQLASITNNLKNKMNTMSTKVKTSMDNMVNKNKTGLNSARNTTQTQLNNITSATTKANQKMVESWDTMKNGIVSAADKIKTDSTKHFDKLGSTIGGFYRKLQNPGGFGAGPGNGTVSRTTRRGSNGFRNIKNAIRKAQLPEYLTLGQIQTNPFISTDNFGSYITRDKNNKFRVSDLIRSGNIRIPIGLEDPRNKGAGSWMDGVPKHIQKIKDTSKNWSMKGPKIIGKYQTSHGFKVGEFMNGTPNISFETFKGMAEDVFGQTHYDFYYDDQKHGNWMGAFRDGYMNCYHGALALIAFANACGLSGNLVHGHWNQYGHFWANIAGHKMDVTGWQQQRNWTPAASHAGPGPKTPTFGDLIDELNNDKTEIVVGDSNSSGEVIFGGEFTIVHDFINLPEGISAEEVARLINDAPDDTNWLIKLIKKIVQDKDFQKFDLKEKAKIERRNKRALGV